MPSITLLNPGFEVDATGWTPTSCTVVRSTVQASAGVASGLLTSSVAGNPIVTTRPDGYVPPQGEVLTFTVDLYGTELSTGKTVRVQINEVGGGTAQQNTQNNHVMTEGWQRVSVVHTILQSDRTALDCYVNPRSFAIGDTVHIDEAALSTPDPSAHIIAPVLQMGQYRPGPLRAGNP